MTEWEGQVTPSASVPSFSFRAAPLPLWPLGLVLIKMLLLSLPHSLIMALRREDQRSGCLADPS